MKTLQAVERLVGGVTCSLLGLLVPLLPSSPPPPQKVRRVLLVKFWGIGSIVLATPLFLKAREVFPRAEIVLLTLSGNRGVVKMLPGVDRVETIDLGASLISALLAYVRALAWAFRLRPDIVFDLEFYTKASAVLCFFTRASSRVGYHSQGVWRGNIHNMPVAFNVYRHVSSNFLSLLEPYGVATTSAPPASSLLGLDSFRKRALGVLARHGLSTGRYILVNVNAGELAVERRWPQDRFATLSAGLWGRYRLPIVYIGAGSERGFTSRAWALAEQAGARGTNLAGEVDLEELVGLCAHSALVVTNDSGPLHLAVAAGARTVSIFGPETPVLYGPPGPGHVVMFADISCSPCVNAEHGKRTACWRGSLLCQLAIPADAVLESIERAFGPSLREAGAQAQD